MTLGPLLVAVMFNTFLYGLCLLQFITYFTSGTRDRPSIKLMIVWELLVDTFHTALLVYTLWHYVVDNFKNEASFLSNPWPLDILPVMTVLSASPIQIFLSDRVRKLSGSRIVFILLVFLTLVEGCLGFATSAITLQAKKYGHYFASSPRFNSDQAPSSQLGSRKALRGSCRHQSVHASYTTCKQVESDIKNIEGETDYLVSWFIRAAIESGSFASLFTILHIITITLRGDTMIFMVFGMVNAFLIYPFSFCTLTNVVPCQPIGRIYTNTFLAILNSRKGLRRKLHQESLATTTNNVTQSTASEAVPQAPRVPQTSTIGEGGLFTVTEIEELEASSYAMS
ncbi:hypothetical protein GYMLUDRAFT_240580 [Collybiopsis luxurians FD-317 M1]|nr:hypothetical protein GYMLUDRAFT_240580 [Collybiopsis luxurians FD-317 M1]